jgi:hypothetical protein
MRRAQALICLAAMLLPAACTAAPGHVAPHGIVTGKLIREGGPLGPNDQQPASGPIPGTVRFTSGRHSQVITIRTSKAGIFAGQLPAGRYSVSYRSPRLLEFGSGGVARPTWSRPVSVTVTPHHTTRINLTAIVP